MLTAVSRLVDTKTITAVAKMLTAIDSMIVKITLLIVMVRVWAGARVKITEDIKQSLQLLSISVISKVDL